MFSLRFGIGVDVTPQLCVAPDDVQGGGGSERHGFGLPCGREWPYRKVIHAVPPKGFLLAQPRLRAILSSPQFTSPRTRGTVPAHRR